MALVAEPTTNTPATKSALMCGGFSLAALHSITEEQIEKIPKDDLALIARKFSRAYNNVKERKRGRSSNTIICFEFGEPNHIHANCPKLKKKNEKTSKRPEGRGRGRQKNIIKKAINKVLAALEEVQLSDVYSKDDDHEEAKKDKDFSSMCCHANDFFPDMCLMALEEKDDSTEHTKRKNGSSHDHH
ncbi:hypothetical protein E2562_030350 [Oryza meyeriana var. granulata]|uniref:CCHC-type domain-containing protein n=1 Tax=Oryza meyeriana var. granulata TaxID=110450 RepID=A0A6G1D8D7_9ORYZ|nr:hypothetical protein E2562_030350 [Oryza meyeriana var. granulata]